MTDLWAQSRDGARKAVEPLAARMRPRTLDEFCGQTHLLGTQDELQRGERPLLRRMIESGALSSILLHGPPGTGKTTLARVIANTAGRHFVAENAASVGVKRIREVVDDAARRVEAGSSRTILFLDEIHRFSKSQQDVLLEDVERGLVTLIGATTENPLFTVNSALVSRSTLFKLEPLTEDDVRAVLRGAIADEERGYGKLWLSVRDEAIDHWAKVSDGDARRALNALEVAVVSAQQVSGLGGHHTQTGDSDARLDRTDTVVGVGHPRLADVVRPAGGGAAAETQGGQAEVGAITIDLQAAQESVQRKAVRYDRAGDQHYDHASAFIKSMRGNDPDAAVYWLAVMLEAGEDPRFIARRMAILASEDIGNADPRAIMIAEAAWSLCERIGMPEARITLSQCACYLALAPKSNASYMAINAAMKDVQEGRTQPIPMTIRDSTKAKSHGSQEEGKGYQYAHNSSNRTSIGGVTDEDYMTVPTRYYLPNNIGAERVLKERLDEVRKARGMDE